MARLGDVCSFFSGTGFPNAYQGQKTGKYPFYKVGDISKNVLLGNRELISSDNYIDDDTVQAIKGTVLPPKTVVFAKIGEALRLNRRAITNCYCLVDNNAMGILADNTVLDGLYFYYFMCSVDLQHYCESTTVPSVRKTRIAEIEIPLPSLEEQRRIAAVLDKVSDLIAKRRAQLDKLDLLVKSCFVEMFGDPVSNPYDWNLRGLLQLGDCKNGMNFHSTDVGINIHCLGVGDFKNLSCISDTSTLPTVSLTDMPSDEYMLKDGDLVFVRSNGNKALVGRSLVVYPATTPTTFSGFCIRFRLNSDEVKTDYLLRVLKTDSIRKKMAGRGANIQNLNQKILGELQIPVPPLDLQNRFTSFVEQTEKTKTAISCSLDKLETLKKSLMQQYFG